jgi:hypothetical protein
MQPLIGARPSPAAGGQFGEGGLGGRAGGGAVGDEALAGLGDVQHLALELQRAGQPVVECLSIGARTLSSRCLMPGLISRLGRGADGGA